MIAFIIKSIVCSALLYAVYVIFLEKQKMHQFNRFYLLSIPIFSIVLPNLVIHTESEVISPLNYISNVALDSFQLVDYMNYIIGVYTIVVVVLSYRFLIVLQSVLRTIKENPKINYNTSTIVLLKENILPHTFLGYVFVNKETYESQEIGDELLTHELTHVGERHTIDILLVELFHIIFWFNPIVVLLKKSIRLNHEFIADDAVINTFEDTIEYQHILLTLATWDNSNGLTSNLNYSLTKKRFSMMVKKSSNLRMNITRFSIIPILMLFVFLFANTSVSEEHKGGEHGYENAVLDEEERNHHEIEGSNESHGNENRNLEHND